MNTTGTDEHVNAPVPDRLTRARELSTCDGKPVPVLPDPPRFTYDLGRCIAIDVEVYPGRWCVGFRGRLGPGDDVSTEIVDGDSGRLATLLCRFARGCRILVGYNSARFDVPLVRLILAGVDPYAAAQAIIADDRMPSAVAKAPPFPPDHIDLSARTRRGGRFPSLKLLAARLGRGLLRELPYAPGTLLTDEQWAEVREYNDVDLGHTLALLEVVDPELEALATLSQELGEDLRSTPSPRVVETVFDRAYERARKTRPVQPVTPPEVFYRPPPGVRRPRTPEAAAWYDSVANRPLRVVQRGGRPVVDVPDARFKIGNLGYRAEKGGLHSKDSPRVYYATRRHDLVSVDVASFYPSLIAENNIAPAAYGDCGAATYRDILTRRLETKRKAKEAVDPAERKRLDVQANALKLVLNSTFGKFGDPHSTLFDLSALLSVTLTGQLMLIDLIERLREAGARILSVNTDGLYLRVRRTNKRWRQVLEQWQADTSMRLEVDPIKRLLILATNRFAVLEKTGTIKAKGAGLKTSLSPATTPNTLVIADATVNALLRDVPPEQTIRACTDPVRFCRVTHRTAKVQAAVLLEDDGKTEIELPKVTRWYKARGTECRIVHRLESGKSTTPADAKTGVGLALDLSDGRLPRDLDYAWYAAQARKVIQSVPGYRHRSRRRLGDSTPALRVADMGLVPAPKFGKAQPPGADCKRPTHLWDWSNYPTVGTYTGPAVGVLVVDVDDPLPFRTFVDKGNAPLLMNRWGDLRDCLVSVHGDANADEVRAGRARGKLIFRFEADESHPLATMRVGHWSKTRGVDVFFGRGLPSVLGRYDDGDAYRLEGTLGPPPEWLIEGLIPRAGKLVARAKAPASIWSMEVKGSRGRSKGGGTSLGVVPTETSPEELDDLAERLAALSEDLARPAVNWRLKELDEGRCILVGRCPFEHDSGTGSDGDLAAGFAPDGSPFLRCLHTSCEGAPAVSAQLRETWRAATTPTVTPPPLVLTEIAQSINDGLSRRAVTLNLAATGSGKTHSIVQVATDRFRRDQATLIAVPTLRLAGEVTELLKSMAPDAFEVGAVAEIYGRPAPIPEDGGAVEGAENAGDGDEGGSYPIHEWTRIIVCTHAQLGRRGFSRYIRGIWAKLGVDKEKEEGGRESHPPFCLIIDEIAELIRECRRELPLAHRAVKRFDPDGSGGAYIPIVDCPKSNRSGNCRTCVLLSTGGEAQFNAFGIREVVRPRPVEFSDEGKALRKRRKPLEVDDRDLLHGEWSRVGATTFAAKVLAYRGMPIGETTRQDASHFIFRKGEEGEHPAEEVHEIISHMLQYAFRPVLTKEQAIDADIGGRVSAKELQRRIDRDDRDWARGIVFPWGTCEVPTLRFADLAGLEQMRRYAVEEGVGIALTGATLGPDDGDVLRAVWPALEERTHPYPPRRVRQVAVAFLEGYKGAEAMIGPDERLVTVPLESCGLGLVFLRTRPVAKMLFDRVKLHQPSVRLGVENNEGMTLLGSLHNPGEPKCIVTYSRGVLGLGANVTGIRYLVVDARAFRAIAGFTPGELTPEQFERCRAEERLAIILQNLGRAIRGEAGKTVCLFVLNADEPLAEAIKASPAIREGAELPPVFAAGEDLAQLIDQARRWLEAGGGDWPPEDPEKASPCRRGRPKGSATRTREQVLELAERALADGVTWRNFTRKEKPERQLEPAEVEDLKARFKERAAGRPARAETPAA